MRRGRRWLTLAPLTMAPGPDAPRRSRRTPRSYQMTERHFEQDAYLRECDAVVVSAGDGGIELDRTVFIFRSRYFLSPTDKSTIPN